MPRGKAGGVAGMPRVLAFQSVADATVSTPAVVSALFDRLAPEGHALVAAVVARHRAAGTSTVDSRPTGLRWPLDTYSLAHVALPFSPDDPVYGATPAARWDFMFLGKVGLYGERGVLAVSPGDFARLRHNPFFPYVESRVGAFLAARER